VHDSDIFSGCGFIICFLVLSQNGDVYFEKFLKKFVDVLLDRWKALSVTHALSVIFFGRTLFVDPSHDSDLQGPDSISDRLKSELITTSRQSLGDVLF